tara:strand:- start:4472 stop:4834 length:363 start_codon:yes stop_codon:yes gene_type:complete
MSKVKENEKADYCLEYIDKPACSKYSRFDKVTENLDNMKKCCILQKSIGNSQFRAHFIEPIFETSVYLSKDSERIHILHCNNADTMYATYHTTKLSVSDFKKINKALNKNLKIRKEKKNN